MRVTLDELERQLQAAVNQQTNPTREEVGAIILRTLQGLGVHVCSCTETAKGVRVQICGQVECIEVVVTLERDPP